MIAVGFWGMRKTRSLNDFFLGNRTVGPWISAFAYGTTYFSAVLFIGFAGKIGWGFGLHSFWIVLGNSFLGSFLAWIVLGGRTRRMSHNLNAMTMPEFLSGRFGSEHLKIFSALIIFIFLLPYSASVFKGLGYLFEANFHISYDLALLVMIAITGIYLILGGYFAITLTDFIQGIIMIFGSFIMVFVLVNKAGGSLTIIPLVASKYSEHVSLAQQPTLLTIISLVFMTSFGTWGMPQMVQKFYAIKNESMILKAAIVTTLFSFTITGAAYFTGAMAHVFYDAPPLISGVSAFDQIIPNLLTEYLPPFLMALIMLLVLSASMSTLSSLVLVSASAIAIDLCQGRIRPGMRKENSLLMIRFLSGVFIVLSYFIAKTNFSLIVTLMSLSWGVVSGAFMAPFVYGLYWKRVTLAGVACGMLSGVTAAIVLFSRLGPQNSPLASTIAMVIPFFVIPLVSFCTKPPDVLRIQKAFQGIAE